MYHNRHWMEQSIGNHDIHLYSDRSQWKLVYGLILKKKPEKKKWSMDCYRENIMLIIWLQTAKIVLDQGVRLSIFHAK